VHIRANERQKSSSTGPPELLPVKSRRYEQRRGSVIHSEFIRDRNRTIVHNVSIP
jgi:hypothetical protein